MSFLSLSLSFFIWTFSLLLCLCLMIRTVRSYPLFVRYIYSIPCRSPSHLLRFPRCFFFVRGLLTCALIHSLYLLFFLSDPFFFHFYSTRLSPIPPFLFLFIYLSLNVRFFLPQVGDFFFYIKRKRSPLPLFFCFSFLFICHDFESSI